MSLLRLVTVLLLEVLIATGATGQPSSRPAAVIVDIDGDVMLQRSEWTGFAPLFLGSIIHRGDIIDPRSDGARVKILCPDLSLVVVSRSMSGLPCPEKKPIIMSNRVRVSAARSTKRDYPVLIYPRSTDILEDRPLIQWIPGSNVEKSVVRIEGPDLSWTSPETSGSTLQYPDEAPRLIPEVDYQVYIEQGNRNSSEDGIPESGFRIVSKERSDKLNKNVELLTGLDLSDRAKLLVVSRMHEDQRLLGVAIQMLEDRTAPAGTPEFMLMGEIRLRLHRTDEALDAFAHAVEKADKNDVEALSLARKMLGRLLMKKDPAKAKAALKRALEGYTKLGDETSLGEIRRLLH